MMKKINILALALAVLLFTTAKASPVKNKNKLEPQKLCPVMGMEINREVFIDYRGKRIYFCCPDCINKFKADPAMYLKKTAEQGSAVAEAPKMSAVAEATKMQTNCPVMEMKVIPGLYIDRQGKRIYFCCPSCLEKFDSDPQGYIRKMERQGITFEKTPDLKRGFHKANQGEEQKHQH